MSNATRKPAAPVAEICLYGTSRTGAGWLARGQGTALLGNGEAVADRTFTLAVWQAVDALREAGLTGVVAIYAPGGDRVALAPLGNVPAFGDLKWSAAGEGIVITAAQVLEASK